MEVNCLYPIVIVSPTLRQDVLRSEYIVIDGHRDYISPEIRYKVLMDLDKTSSILHLPYLRSITEEDYESLDTDVLVERELALDKFIENSYLISVDGESLPVYQYVPCGHCDLCNHRKLVSLCQRSQFAMEQVKRPALFVTLTYNKYHIPNDHLVRKRHIDLFKKRLKKAAASLYSRIAVPTIVNGEIVPDKLVRLSRSKILNEISRSIKFICASEYGKKGRPHYHLMVFGLPRFSSFDPEHDYFCRKLVQYCWRVPVRQSDGLFQSFDSYLIDYPKAFFKKGEHLRPSDIDVLSYGISNAKEVSSSRCAKYVLKYVFKDRCSGDKRPSFLKVSQSLGLDFVKMYSECIENSDGVFRYVSHFDQCLKEVQLSNYYIKKIFPTYSLLVPKQLRVEFYNCYLYNYYIQNSDLHRDLKLAVSGAMNFLEDNFPLCVLYHRPDHRPDFLGRDSFVSFDRVQSVLDIQSNNPVFLQNFFQSYSICCSYIGKVDFKDIDILLSKRDKYLEKVKHMSRSQKLDISASFRRDIIFEQSKSYL